MSVLTWRNIFWKKGCDVIIYDNLSRKGSEINLRWLKSHHNNFKFIKGDIRDFEHMKNVLSYEVDAIIHAAAQVAVTRSLQNPKEDLETNIIGTFNILELARKSYSRPFIVYFSTNKVYVNNVNKIPIVEGETRYWFKDKKYKFGIPENFPTDSDEHTPYGISKYAAELYVRDYCKNYSLPSVSLRCSCIYGPQQFGNEDQGWIAHFIISSIFDRPLTIYGNGKQVRDILFIEDLNKLVELAINNSNRIKGLVFNVGGGVKNTCSLLELIQILEEKLGKKIKYKFVEWRPGDQKVYVSDIRKVKRVLKWEPKTTIEKGIRKMIEWVKNNKKLFHFK
ncbi:MAG: GDP-mannose 4,6-dehydratase [Candidatus Aenigmatarchaeota archaeon]